MFLDRKWRGGAHYPSENWPITDAPSGIPLRDRGDSDNVNARAKCKLSYYLIPNPSLEQLYKLQDQSTVILFHAELDSPGNAYGVPANNEHPPGDPTFYSTFLKSRPQKLETDAISLILKVQRKNPSLRCHIVHLSAASALPLIRAAKSSGLKLTAETCFHYLCLSADQIPNGRPQFKCCPPIREQAN